MNDIEDQFNRVSRQYDSQRPLLIPCFEDFYTIALPLIRNFEKGSRVLDIGAGTGLFSQFVYQERPDLQFTLIDLSPEMLAVARERFAGKQNVEFVTGDITKAVLTDQYDVVISALAIHHLADSEKEALYQAVFNSLKPGGLFINADQVEGRNGPFDSYFKNRWEQQINAAGLAQQAIDSAMERIKLDKFSKLETQLLTLEKTGFIAVDCIYKYNNFAVFGGFRP